MTEDASWGEYRRLVLQELERINSGLDAANESINKLRREDIAQIKTDIAILQLKAGAWGGLAGVIVTVGAILLRQTG